MFQYVTHLYRGKRLYKDGNNCIKSFVIKKKKAVPPVNSLCFNLQSVNIQRNIIQQI